MKTLLLDIETAPLLAFVWSPWGQDVAPSQLQSDSFMLTWAAKWRGEDEVFSAAVTSREATKQNDKRITRQLGNLISEADIVIAHNLDRFDLPKINTRLLYHGLEPLAPVKQIDTLKLAKKAFRVTYNRLDYLGEFLGVGKKLKTDFALWQRAYFGDADAIDEMLTYNLQDVVLLEAVFERMLPYVSRLPRMVVPEYDEQHACPTCGSEDLQKRGFYSTNVSLFQRFQCNNCGRYNKYRRSEKLKFDVSPL